MRQDTRQKIQKKEGFKKELLPKKRDISKGIDFRKYKVASPSELINEPIKDKKQATSTSLNKTENSTGFSSIMGR
ncbi:unnamed protein product [marine sediment metagenome]|uniref:Uncharacterized protein n=1 Tax=marine sediment metagenome TaxID=412755 RepID=X1NTZ8_9ZZZZ